MFRLMWFCRVVCGFLRGLEKKRGKDQYVGNIYLKNINNSLDKNKGNQHRDGVWLCEKELT